MMNYHTPVLLNECIESLHVRHDYDYADALLAVVVIPKKLQSFWVRVKNCIALIEI